MVGPQDEERDVGMTTHTVQYDTLLNRTRWWRAFLSAGSSAGYLFVYSVWYFYSKLEITGFVPTMVYFGYMLVIALTFFLLTGSSGFFACFW